MATFTDTCGREWNLDFNMSTLKRMGGAAVLNDSKRFAAMLQEPLTLAQFVAEFLAPQLAAHALTEDDLLSAMNGETLEAAQNAFIEATIEFLPRAKAEALRQALTKLRAAENELLSRAMQQLEAFDPLKMFDKAIAV